LRVCRRGTIFLTFFLINTLWVFAASKSNYALKIKVLSAETESIPLNSDANGAPRDCNLIDYSAYCHYLRTAIVRHTMVVQDSHGESFTICCAVDSIWSRCSRLPVGEMFEAHKAKGGITVSYPDLHGKERKQLYQVTVSVPEPGSGGAAPASAGSASETVAENVPCNFSSTPSGADIAIDGKYVGNTPSEIGLSLGMHIIVITLSGFDQWKRELTVAADSVVNVTATLQKAQP
jgi:PEGA domain